jgi:PKD repeat protein
LSVLDSSGCSSTISKTVNIYPKPNPSIVYKSICESTVYQFNALNNIQSPIIQWFWEFNPGMLSSTLSNPVINFNDTGSYLASLSVTDINQCSQTIQESFSVYNNYNSGVNQPSLYLPVLWIYGDSLTSDNGKVLFAKDLSGKNNHLNQSDAGFQPFLTQERLNGHQVISLDGIDDFMNFTSKINDLRTLFFVVKHNNPTIGSFGGILGDDNSYDFLGDGSIGDRLFDPVYASSNILDGSARLNGVTIDNVRNLKKPIDYSIISIVTTGNTTASRLSKDRGFADRVWSGNYAEVILYNTPLDSAQITDVENYLFEKYAPRFCFGNSVTTCSFPYTIHAFRDYIRSYQWNDGSSADSLLVNSPGYYSLTITDVFNRTYSDSIFIDIDSSNFVLNLPNDTNFCQGQNIQILTGPEHLFYSWSNGNSSNTLATDTAGLFIVNYINCKNNSFTDSIFIHIQPLPFFDFPIDTLMCYNTSRILDPLFDNSSNLSFYWSNQSNDSVLTINNSGTYALEVKNLFGCSFSDTLNVIIDSSLALTSLGPDTNLCSGNVLYLKNGADNAVSYSWNNGSSDSTLTITQSGTYWLSVSNVNGCSVTDSINLIVIGFAPNTLFTLTDACINDSVAFLDLSTTQQPSDVVSSWLWDFGDGNTSTLQNPKHLFDTAGNYIVSLETTTNSGCSKVKKLNYTVYPLPVPSFSFLNNCQYANTQFTFNGNTYGDFLSGIKWQFGLNPLDTSNSLSPVFVFTQSGPQPVTITIKTEKGCVISENSTVNVKQGPLADFYASEACAGENITLVDISDVNFPHTIINREWNFGDGSWAGNSATPSHFYILPGKYNVFLKVTASSGCSDTVTKTIAIDPKPVANFGYENNCLNSPTLFTNSTGISNIGGILWEIDDLFSTTQDSFNYVFNDTGRYSISFIIKTSGGCADTIIKTLTISSLPTAAFNLINSEEDLPVSIELENKSLNATTFLWNFDDGNISSSPNPVHVYTKEDDYTIKLFAFNAEDCIDSTQKDIRIKSAKYDLALLDLNPVINNKGFLEPEIRIANLGTRIINNFDVYLIINGENSISEDWNGTLLPGQTEVYRLKSGTKINIKENTYMCISVANPNQKTESDSTNNVLCKELLGDNLVLADISPNPAKESILAPIISPEAGKGNIYIYSKSGQLISENAIELMKGIQLVPINIKELNNGLYTLSVSFKDKQVSKRFMKE